MSTAICKGLIDKVPKAETIRQGWPWTEETDARGYMSEVTWPKISIVTPSFNQGEYIEETIRSVILQNYPNIEYIIIDGGSTDQTVDIIKKYKQYITYWVSEPDQGQSHAIQKGVERCSGDIFNWLNSDDYLEAGALKKIAEHFQQHQADIVCTASYNMLDGKKISIHPQTYKGKKLLVNIGWATRMNQQGMFYRLDVIRKLGGINASLHYCMDFEMWLRYLLQYGNEKVFFSSEVLSYFRIHQSSKTQMFDNPENDVSHFRDEYNSVYLYLAKKSCKRVVVNLIRTFSKEVNEKLQIHLLPNTPSLTFMQSSVYYYLYAQLSYYLHKNQYKMVHRILMVLHQTRPFSLMNYKLLYAVVRYRIKELNR